MKTHALAALLALQTILRLLARMVMMRKVTVPVQHIYFKKILTALTVGDK